MAAAKRLVWLRAAAVALGCALLAWLVYATVHAGSDIPPPQMQGPTLLQGGAANGKRIDGKSWSLDYRQAVMSADGGQAEIDDVHDGLIFRNGRPYMHVRAKHVSANLTTNDFRVQGPVAFVEIGGQHRQLDTVDAHYLGFSQTLVLPNRTIVREGAILLVVAHATVNFQTGATQLGRIVGSM